MWVVAGVLLGSMVLAALASLHIGPHGHGLAAALGGVAAVWLLVMVAEGQGRPLLFALLSADLVMSAALGLLAWRGLSESSSGAPRAIGPDGARGIALNDLDPLGIVRVGGEEWTAESINGRVKAGSSVQVVGRTGIRVQVWGEPADPLGELEVFTPPPLIEPLPPIVETLANGVAPAHGPGAEATAAGTDDGAVATRPAEEGSAAGAQVGSGPAGSLRDESEAQI